MGTSITAGALLIALARPPARQDARLDYSDPRSGAIPAFKDIGIGRRTFPDQRVAPFEARWLGHSDHANVTSSEVAGRPPDGPPADIANADI